MAETRVGVTLEGKDNTGAMWASAASRADEFKGKMGQVKGALAEIATFIGAFVGVQKLVGFLKDSTAEAIKDNTALDLLRSRIVAVGGSLDNTLPQLTGFVDKMTKLGQSQDITRDAVGKFLTITGNANKAMELTKLAADLATSGLGDYEGNVQKVTAILSGKGSRALVEFGIQMDENATVAERLDALQQRVTRSSEQYALTTEGMAKRMGNAWHTFSQNVGTALLPMFNDIGNAFTSFFNQTNDNSGGWVKEMAKVFDQYPKQIFPAVMMALNDFGERWVGVFVGLVGATDNAVKKIADAFSTTFSKIGDLISKLPLGNEFINDWKTVGGEWKKLWGDLHDNNFLGLTESWKKDVGQWQKLMEDIRVNGVDSVTKDLQVTFKRQSEEWGSIFDSYADDFNATWDAIQRGSGKFVDNLLTDFTDMGDGGADLKSKFADAFREIAKSVVSSISDQRKAILGLDKDLDALKDKTQKTLADTKQAQTDKLLDMARQATAEKAKIDKEIADTQNAAQQREGELASRGGIGWRTDIDNLKADTDTKVNALMADRAKQQDIIDRIAGRVGGQAVQDAVSKDDLQIVFDDQAKEIDRITKEGDAAQLEVAQKIVDSQHTIADMMTKLADPNFWEQAIGQMQQQAVFNFNFAGDVLDKDAFIQQVITAINRDAQLRGVAGK